MDARRGATDHGRGRGRLLALGQDPRRPLTAPGGPIGCGTYEFEGFLQPPDPVHDGDVAAFFAPGDCAGENPDLSLEVFVADRNAQAAIRPGKDDPTVVTWDAESGPARYDVIRGDVSGLGPDGDLGVVVCVEDDSTDTVGDPDADIPAPGQAFFYLYRGAQGPSETGTYGRATSNAERLPSSGDCPGI